MGVPKRKVSKARQGERRAHLAIGAPPLVELYYFMLGLATIATLITYLVGRSRIRRLAGQLDVHDRGGRRQGDVTQRASF